MIKKIILSTACGLLLSSMVVNAQSRHELSVLGGGGLSTLNYKSTVGSEKLGFGGHAGIGYTFFFNENWGIGTGAECTFYNSIFEGDFHSTYPTVDKFGENFEYTATLNDYREKQRSMFINIPLMVQFQTNNKHKFYAALGGKLGIPVSTKFKTNDATLHATGYYSVGDVTYGNDQNHTFLGLGNFPIEKTKGDLDLKLAFMVSAEVGMKWNFRDNVALYTGVYADYGVNNVIDGTDKNFVEYNTQNPEEFAVNSIMNSKYTNKAGQSVEFTDKVAPLAVGLKIRVSFGLGKKFKEYQYDEYPYVGGGAQPQNEQDLTAIKELLDQYRAEDEKRYQEMLDKIEKDAAQGAASEVAKEEAKEEFNQERSELTQVVDNYEVGVVGLNASQRAQLDKKIAIMKQHPSWKMVLVGHTCDIGASMTNKNVGQERADAVMEYMVQNGVARDRIISVSRGMEEPVVPNTNDANRKRNRRIEFLVTQY